MTPIEELHKKRRELIAWRFEIIDSLNRALEYKNIQSMKQSIKRTQTKVMEMKI